MKKKKIDYTNWSKDELIKELKRIKETTYGLVWHRDVPHEKIDVLINPDARTPAEIFANEVAGKPFPVLKEVKSKEVISDKSAPTNILIEGDNYHSLAVLNFTHQAAIDVIYIDPPYNTGNKDFKYTDAFKNDYVDKDDPFKHSKWLSFMEKRILLAKNLLKEEGVIFISIDYHELAPLKLLCDEIFEERNFVTNISRLMKSGGNKGRHFSPNIDYILVYAKEIEKLKDFRLPLEDEYINKIYSRIEKEGKRKGERYREMGLYQAGLDSRPNQRYWIKCPNGSFVIPPGETLPKKTTYGEKVKPNKNDGVWRWIFTRYQNELKKGNIVFKKTKTSSLVDENGKQSKWNIYTKIWLNDRSDDGRVPTNFLTEFENRNSSRELKEMGVDFQFAKPKNLIKWLVKIINSKNNIQILDFMAGSGTTGHAVLDLNKEDGGNRKFILCTNNESNICTDVCHPRLKKVIKGYKNNNGEKVEGLGGNLKYYTAYDFVESEQTDKNKRKLVKKSTEMICIKEGIFDLVTETDEYKIFKNTNDKYLGIIFYDEAIDKYKKAIKKIDQKINTYVFSLNDDPHTKEFIDMKDRVSLQAIPEVILKVYQEIFK